MASIISGNGDRGSTQTICQYLDPLSSICRTDVYELNKGATAANHVGTIIGVTLLVTTISAAISIAVACNCPQLYVEDSGSYHFTNGLYSGAVYSTLERTDHVLLSNIPAGVENISFKIANGKEEEQFINQVQLLKWISVPETLSPHRQFNPPQF